jgi:hypothetical protein
MNYDDARDDKAAVRYDSEVMMEGDGRRVIYYENSTSVDDDSMFDTSSDGNP